jgi:signal recognition particle subunit SRP54
MDTWNSRRIHCSFSTQPPRTNTDATFDFDDFLKQMEIVSNMGGIAKMAKMLPAGLLGGGKLQEMSAQFAQAEQRVKKQKAMISSMNKKERANPDLFIRDQDARTRLLRITKGSGTTLEEGLQFIEEFQQMRTLMRRMAKKIPKNGNDVTTNDDDDNDGEMVMPEMGNRATRRSGTKKSKKASGRGGGAGFG